MISLKSTSFVGQDMNREELMARGKRFALRVLKMTDALPHSGQGKVIRVINHKPRLASGFKPWIKRHTTINENSCTVDVIRIIGSQPHGRAANLDWFTNAFVRN